MLSNFYIIILLVCIEWTFSYNHIYDASGRTLHKCGRYAKRTTQLGRNRIRKKLIHQKHDYDSSPVDDVASIQPGDELVEEEVAIRDYDNKRGRSNSYEYDALLDVDTNDNNKQREDYLSFDETSYLDESLHHPIRRDDTKAKNTPTHLNDINAKSQGKPTVSANNVNGNENNMIIQGPSHHPAKKCAFRRIQFPRFFHKKHKAVAPKSPKKRKLFCFSNSKKGASHANENRSHEDPFLEYKVKRSYKDKIYPIFRKKSIGILKSERPKKTPKKMIHNSRQFFQKHAVDAKVQDSKTNLKDLKQALDQPHRKKRQDIDARVRQLKELEEVENKINKIKVTMPVFSKLPDISNVP